MVAVDTGKGLSGREVLLPPSVLGTSIQNPKGHEFSVELTMQQVKDSQYIDTDRPVSRQMETPAGECAQQTFWKTADTQRVANNAHYVKDNRAPACLPVISSDLYGAVAEVIGI